MKSKEIRPFGIFRESYALHFYIFQFTVFLFVLYRLLSRDYTVYGYLNEQSFDYLRSFTIELLPLQYFVSFHFIYQVLPFPNQNALEVLQLCAIGFSILGLIGIRPRIMSGLVFFTYLHILGFMHRTNAEIDGSSLFLCSLIILALTPGKFHYSWGNGFDIYKKDVNYHWPIALLFCTVGAFYTMSGINKIIDVGPHWPLVVNLDQLAYDAIERSMFYSSRLAIPEVAILHKSYLSSVIGGFVTMIGEIGFLSILFLPRYRFFFVFSMIALHIIVYQLAGINFLGSSAILLMCFDYNIFLRKGILYYDSSNPIHVKMLKKYRRLKRIEFKDDFSDDKLEVEIAKQIMCFVDENNEYYYGADAIEQLATRRLLSQPFAVILKIPGVFYFYRIYFLRQIRAAI